MFVCISQVKLIQKHSQTKVPVFVTMTVGKPFKYLSKYLNTKTRHLNTAGCCLQNEEAANRPEIIRTDISCPKH